MKIAYTLTDSFGGEANYGWAVREEEEHPDGLTDLQLVRRVKRWAGWTGRRCRVERYDTEFRITPIGARAPCMILFAEVQYPS